MDEDWNGIKTKVVKLAKQTDQKSDWEMPLPQYIPDYKPGETDTEGIDKLTLDPDYPG